MSWIIAIIPTVGGALFALFGVPVEHVVTMGIGFVIGALWADFTRGAE